MRLFLFSCLVVLSLNVFSADKKSAYSGKEYRQETYQPASPSRQEKEAALQFLKSLQGKFTECKFRLDLWKVDYSLRVMSGRSSTPPPNTSECIKTGFRGSDEQFAAYKDALKGASEAASAFKNAYSIMLDLLDYLPKIETITTMGGLSASSRYVDGRIEQYDKHREVLEGKYNEAVQKFRVEAL